MLKSLSDVNVVAFLLSKGFKQAKPPTCIDAQVLFYFDDPTGEITTEIVRFFNREIIPIEALTFIELVRNLRSQVMMLRRNTPRSGGDSNE